VVFSADNSAPHHTWDVLTKFVPVTMTVSGAATVTLPAAAEAGASNVIVGAPMSTITALDGEPPGFFTTRLRVPVLVRLALGIVTVIAVAVPAVATSGLGLAFK
jgi:hypothetical protein